MDVDYENNDDSNTKNVIESRINVIELRNRGVRLINRSYLLSGNHLLLEGCLAHPSSVHVGDGTLGCVHDGGSARMRS